MYVMQEITFASARGKRYNIQKVIFIFLKFIIRFLCRIGIKCLAKFTSKTICDLWLEFSFREGFFCFLEFHFALVVLLRDSFSS